ncbi:MAG: right-handed parallel beta-helix repeat-containing protein [Planctomycetota bacterium]
MHFRQWVIVAVFCVQVVPLWARDIYVNNVAGSDRNDGSAPEASSDATGPYRTITRALRAAQKGDRVILAETGTPYRESITLQGGKQSGIRQIPFELIGNNAVLDGTRPVPAGAWTHYMDTLFRFRPPKVSFQLLYLDGKPAKRREVNTREEIEDLDRLEWCLFKQHVYFRVEDGRLPQTYELSFTGLQVGITLYQVRHVVIRDLVIQGFQLDGVNAHDGVYNVTLTGLNSRGNARSGISIGGASQVRVEACLVGNNGAAQVRTEGACRAQLEGCDLLDNTAPRIVRDGGKVVVNP